MDITHHFFRLIDALNGSGVTFAVAGGLAAGIHGIPRFTPEICLIADVGESARVLRLARGLGYQGVRGVERLPSHAAGRREGLRLSLGAGEDVLYLEVLPARTALRRVLELRETWIRERRKIPVVSRRGLAHIRCREGCCPSGEPGAGDPRIAHRAKRLKGVKPTSDVIDLRIRIVSELHRFGMSMSEARRVRRCS